jgi:hypothetical protein
MPCLSRICGSITAGLMLSQAIYWTERCDNPEGWFYKTIDEWEREITLTRTEQVTARAILRARGFFLEKYAGMPRKVYFRVDMDRITEAIKQLPPDGSIPTGKRGGNLQARVQETCRQENCTHASRNAADLNAGNLHASVQKPCSPYKEAEISAESTAETTQRESSTANAAMRDSLRAWIHIKNQLPPEEWLRAAHLLKHMGKNLLVAIPRSTVLVEQARARLPAVRELAHAIGYEVNLTNYPDECQLERLSREAPDFYAQMYGK